MRHKPNPKKRKKGKRRKKGTNQKGTNQKKKKKKKEPVLQAACLSPLLRFQQEENLAEESHSQQLHSLPWSLGVCESGGKKKKNGQAGEQSTPMLWGGKTRRRC